MMSAYGAHVSVNTHSVLVEYSTLLEALNGVSHRTITISADTKVTVLEPTALDLGAVVITSGEDSSDSETILFAPGQQLAARELAVAIQTAARGDSPDAVPGLDFVACDVETANADWGSICQMGAVRFRDGVAQESRTWLCQPPEEVSTFDDANIAIHHITADDVRQAPPFAEVIPEFFDFLGTDYWVAHFAQFDSTALLRAAHYSGVPLADTEFYCSLTLARAHRVHFERHGLKYLANDLGITLTKHHNAEADARACGEIVSILARLDGFTGPLQQLMASYHITPGCLTDTRVIPVLIDGVQSRSQRSGHSLKNFPDPTGRPAPENTPQTDSSAAAPATPSAPGSPKNHSAVASPRWHRAATPEVIPEPNPDADPNDPLFGQVVVLSGDFAPHDKAELWQALALRGASVAKNVTKKTTVVVAGSWESKTSKIRKAEELQAKGQAIDMWSQAHLLAALGLSS